jgi:lipopolysaccharide transport system permease protein
VINEIKELIRYINLVRQLVVRDLKVRYKNSFLGFFWSLVNPLVQVATITIVVKYIMRMDIPNYSAYLLAGYLPWVFFQMALLDSSQVILTHRDLIRKVYFPREALPLSVVVSNLVHFILALIVFFAYILFYFLFMSGAPLRPIILLLPVLAVLQSMLLIGLTFFVSSLNAFFEDTKYILVVLLNVAFYITPIMYPAELVYIRLPLAHRELLYNIYLLNPVNMLIDAYRKIMLPGFEGNVGGIMVKSLPLNYTMLGICAVVCVLVCIGGYAFLNSRKWIFAERI